MGFFNWDDSQDAHQQFYGDQQPQHDGKFSHELIGGAASFEAFKAFEDHQRREGKPVSHAFAKEVLAGFAGAEVDKLAETKGLDEYDKVEARRHARENAENLYDQHYGGQEQWHPDYQGPGRW